MSRKELIKEVIVGIGMILFALFLILIIVFLFTSNYSWYFNEHKHLIDECKETIGWRYPAEQDKPPIVPEDCTLEGIHLNWSCIFECRNETYVRGPYPHLH